ncbi:MAG: hypothetical protein C4327_09410 [Meiothermus sp.]
MDLVQAVIRGTTAEVIRVVEGRILHLHPDRRSRDQGPPRTGGLARRRRLPAGLEPLVGTGRLWVASGYLVLYKYDLERWRPAAMELVAGTLHLYLSSLKPFDHSLPWKLYGRGQDPRQNPAWVTWEFHALFLPTPEQIGRLGVFFPSDLAG